MELVAVGLVLGGIVAAFAVGFMLQWLVEHFMRGGDGW